MASMVDASVKVLHWQMAGAPALNGATTGSRIDFFKKIFNEGWGSVNATGVTVANGICTMTFGAAPAIYADSVARVAGCTDVLLNGDQRILSRTETTLSFKTTAANSSQTTGASAMFAPLGWDRPFASTASQVAFRSPAASGSNNFVCFTDNATNYIRAQGFENMTALTSGSQAYPTDGQISQYGTYWHMQYTAAGTNIPWILIGDDRGFYFMVATYFQQGATYTNFTAYNFTDLLPLRAGDNRAAYISGHNTTTFSAAGVNDGLLTRSQGYGWLARPNTSVGSAVPAMVVSSSNNLAASTLWSGSNNAGFGNYPNLADNSLQLADFIVIENPAVAASQCHRGLLPGVAFASQPVNNSFNTFDVVPGVSTGPYANRKVMAVKVESPQYPSSSPNSPGVTFFDVTGPWR